MARLHVIVGEKAEIARELLARGLSPQRVADQVGVSRGAVLDFVRAEQNKPKPASSTAATAPPTDETEKIATALLRKLLQQFGQTDDPSAASMLAGRIMQIQTARAAQRRSAMDETREQQAAAAARVRARLARLSESVVEVNEVIDDERGEPVRSAASGDSR